MKPSVWYFYKKKGQEVEEVSRKLEKRITKLVKYMEEREFPYELQILFYFFSLIFRDWRDARDWLRWKIRGWDTLMSAEEAQNWPY